jgi:hypothetical protein
VWVYNLHVGIEWPTLLGHTAPLDWMDGGTEGYAAADGGMRPLFESFPASAATALSGPVNRLLILAAQYDGGMTVLLGGALPTNSRTVLVQPALGDAYDLAHKATAGCRKGGKPTAGGDWRSRWRHAKGAALKHRAGETGHDRLSLYM